MTFVRVSGSEALAIGSCETKWLFGFHNGYHLESKFKGVAITRGLLGHDILDKYYTEIMKGASADEALEFAQKYMMELTLQAMKESDIDSVTLLSELNPLLLAYFKSPENLSIINDSVILGVEYDYEVALTEDVTLVGRMDMLNKWLRGDYKGEVTPVDHKFVYNFWTENALNMNAQIPAYRALAKAAFPDEVVSRGLINNLRHRKNAQDLFKIQAIRPYKAEMQAVLDNHVKLSRRIAVLKAMPVEEAEKAATRTISKYTCENCSFARLCKAKMNGQDTTEIIATEYQKNTYGYNKTEDGE